MLKRLLAIMLTLCMAFALIPRIALANDAAPRVNSRAESQAETQEPFESGLSAIWGNKAVSNVWWYKLTDGLKYDEHDFATAKSFMEQTGANGVKNGKQLCKSYDANKPATWAGLCWSKDAGDVHHIVSIMFSSELIRLNHGEQYSNGTLSLGGQLDFSGSNELLYVECRNNVIDTNVYSSADFSSCAKLQRIDLQGNTLGTLNISGCAKLGFVSVVNAGLSALDLSGLTKLTELDCTGCPISNIDLSSCAELQKLVAKNCALTALDLSAVTKLNWLNCAGNKLTAIDLDHLKDVLTVIEISNNCIGGILDFSEYRVLEDLHCDNCDLRELYLPAAGTDINVYARGNMLTKVDARSCTGVQTLNVNNNYLTELELTDCSKLNSLMCTNNRLTKLELGDSEFFCDLDCSNNFLTELTIPDSAVMLYRVKCQNNYITKLDLGAFYHIFYLDCSNNSLETLNLVGQCAVPFTPGGDTLCICNTTGNPLVRVPNIPIKVGDTEQRLTITAQGGGYATTVSEWIFSNEVNEQITYIVAEAAAGCTFSGWYAGNTLVSRDARVGVNTLTQYDLTAKFTGTRPQNFVSRYEKSDFVHTQYEYALPDGVTFNAGDVEKISAFAAQKDAQGKSNGEKLMSDFDASKPEDWSFVKWGQVGSELRVTAIYLDANINNVTREYVEEADRYTLAGTLDASGMVALEAVFADNSGIVGANFDGCTALTCIAAHGNAGWTVSTHMDTYCGAVYNR